MYRLSGRLASAVMPMVHGGVRGRYLSFKDFSASVFRIIRSFGKNLNRIRLLDTCARLIKINQCSKAFSQGIDFMANSLS